MNEVYWILFGALLVVVVIVAIPIAPVGAPGFPSSGGWSSSVVAIVANEWA